MSTARVQMPELSSRWQRLPPTIRDPQKPNNVLGLVGFAVFAGIVLSLFFLQPAPGESRPYLIQAALLTFTALGSWIIVRNDRRGFYVRRDGLKFVDPLWTFRRPWSECGFSVESRDGHRQLAVHDKRRGRTWFGGGLYVEASSGSSCALEDYVEYLSVCAATAPKNVP